MYNQEFVKEITKKFFNKKLALPISLFYYYIDNIILAFIITNLIITLLYIYYFKKAYKDMFTFDQIIKKYVNAVGISFKFTKQKQNQNIYIYVLFANLHKILWDICKQNFIYMPFLCKLMSQINQTQNKTVERSVKTSQTEAPLGFSLNEVQKEMEEIYKKGVEIMNLSTAFQLQKLEIEHNKNNNTLVITYYFKIGAYQFLPNSLAISHKPIIRTTSEKDLEVITILKPEEFIQQFQVLKGFFEYLKEKERWYKKWN